MMRGWEHTEALSPSKHTLLCDCTYDGLGCATLAFPAPEPILQGVVRRIGIRASVVHTRQGADIIVPNSQLVTEQVTNWTLTDQLRRIDLLVGVNYGAVPHQVIALLEIVARAHPQVLPEPLPQAFFMGYGDSAINFTLLAWPSRRRNWRPGTAGS